MKKLLLLLSTAFVLSATAQTVTPTPACLKPSITYTTPSVAVTTADFNKDGKMDVATIGSIDGYGMTPHVNQVFIQFGDGTGHVAAPVMYQVGSPTDPSLNQITSTDFNNDGNVDVAVTDGTANVVWLLLGTSTGTLGTPTSFSVGSGPIGIIHADFNSDGNQDLAVANYGTTNSWTNQISILLGTGTGSFNAPITCLANLTGVAYLATADFNHDNILDLTVSVLGGSEFGQSISVLKGTGTGSFGSATKITVGSSSATGDAPWGISTGYFNNDLNPDIAVANFGTREVTVLLGSPTGTFVSNGNFVTSTIGGNNPSALVCADINLDGITDIAVTDGYINILHGIGNGSFTTAAEYDSTAGGTALAMADFNNDGKIDLLSNSGISLNCSSVNCINRTFTNARTICSGTSVIIGPHTYTANGTYTDSLHAVMGCDSIIVTTLTVTASPTITVTTPSGTAICAGSSGQLVSAGASTYTWTTSETVSTIVLNSANNISVTPLATSTYTVKGTAANGCISTVAKTITVNPVPTLTVNPGIAICPGNTTSFTLTASGANSYTWASSNGSGNTLGATTVITPTATMYYSAIGANSYGCTNTTSAIVLVSVAVTVKATTTATVCAGSPTTLSANWVPSYTWSTGETTSSITVSPTVTTVYTVTGTGYCTTTATSTVYVNPTYTLNNPQTICGGSYTFNGHTYTTTGTYYDSFHTTQGCDSIIVTQLTVGSPYSVTNPQTVCGSYNIGVHTYTASGIYTDVLHTTLGCDSTVITQLTVNPTYTLNNPKTICGGSYTFNGHTYTTTGTYYDTFHTTLGCDSIIATQLTINPTYSVTNPQTVCGSYSIGAHTYTASGTYTDALHTTLGCDSVVVTQLTVNPLPTAIYTLMQDPAPHTWDVYPTFIGGSTPYTYDWSWGDASADATTEYPNHTYNVAGTYSICLTVTDANSCASTYCEADAVSRLGNNSPQSSMVYVNVINAQTSGISTLNTQNSTVQIYPNPAQNNFTIEVSSNEKQTISILDVNGKQVLTQTIQGTTNIDASSLNAGVYNVSTTNTQGVINKHLVIVK